MDPGRIKAEQRALYEAGEYAALSATLRPVARELVAAAGVKPGHRVLDVGAGDGNVAIEATSIGGVAIGCDLSVVQMARARHRAPRIAWLAADAEHLPFRDHTFDAVVSCFGAVFAPDPARVTAELFRMVVPGGVVAISAWAEDGFMGELTTALRSASTAPDSFPDQDLGWGCPDTARELLAPHATSVDVHRQAVLIDDAVRGAAGDQDYAVRYLAQRTLSSAFAETRDEIAHRHLHADGVHRSDYLLIVGRAAD